MRYQRRSRPFRSRPRPRSFAMRRRKAIRVSKPTARKVQRAGSYIYNRAGMFTRPKLADRAGRIVKRIAKTKVVTQASLNRILSKFASAVGLASRAGTEYIGIGGQKKVERLVQKDIKGIVLNRPMTYKSYMLLQQGVKPTPEIFMKRNKME